MQNALHLKATVLPGNRIEVTAPELKEGDEVDIFLIVPAERHEPRMSALDIIERLKGHRLYETPEEADRYLKEERDSWDR